MATENTEKKIDTSMCLICQVPKSGIFMFRKGFVFCSQHSKEDIEKAISNIELLKGEGDGT